MQRVLVVLLALIVAVLVVSVGVANRHIVSVTLDPFGRMESPLAFDLPLALLMFVVFMAGLILGGLATWLGQGKWRRTARTRTREVYHWRAQADRLAREIDEKGPGSGRPQVAKLAHGR